MTRVTVDADAIPDELQDRDQWLLWDRSADKKQPFTLRNGDLVPASWTDPDDWLSFDRAYEVVRQRDPVGLGYMFAKGLDDYPRGLYSGLDLDGCLEQRGRPKDWLPELEPFNNATYIEYSPSGDGIHIPLVGIDVPEWWTNAHFSEEEHEGVEFYDKKFFTFTGDTLETSTDSVGDLAPDDVHDWLAEVYETITGTDPRAQPQQSLDESTPRDTKKSREELEDVETTSEYDDVLDAVNHLEPNDVRLRSRKVEDENSEYESWNPSYRQSSSGKSLKRHKQTGVFFDMAFGAPGGGYDGFDVLSLFAAEEGIIRRPWDDLSGDDFKEAVAAARGSGAPIPEFVGGGDLPKAAKETSDVELDAETLWEFWSDARQSGEFDSTAVIPELALWHIAREHTTYDLDALPEDVSELPPKAHNKALWWVNNEWPEQTSLDVEEDEDVTARSYKSKDTTILTWEDVRYVYEGSGQQPDKSGGRFAAVNLLRSKYEFATPEDTERLHIYEPELGVYERTAELVVDRELDANLGRYYSQHEKNEIIGRLKAGTYEERRHFDAGHMDGLYLCVENGVIDLDSRELLDHDPRYLFTTRLPVEFESDAPTEEIESFLDDITRREEDKLTMLEMLGNCFLPNYDYESFMVLFGEGANGKSTFFEVARSLLGRENVSSMTLQTLSDNQFAASNLVGKIANIGEDLPEKKIQDMGTLKDLTGGGTTSVEPKGKQRFEFENRAKLMFAANRPPALGERSQAVKRRLVPIRLPYEFVSDPDPDDPSQKQARKEGLVDDLTSAENLSGLLALALDGLDRLREQKDVSLPESYEERLEYYEQFSDPIKEFSINCVGNAEGKRIKKDTVYNAYTEFCRQNDYQSTTRSMFWRELNRSALNVSIVRPRENDSRVQYVDHAAFSEYGAQFAPETDSPPLLGDEPSTEQEYGDITPLSQLAEGDLVTITAELKQTYTPDTTKNWYELEGWLVDETGAAKVIVRDDAGVTLKEDTAYRFERVNPTHEDGVMAVEVVPNISTVTEIELGDGSTDPDGASWLSAGVPDSDAAEDASGDSARADGGTDSAESGRRSVETDSTQTTPSSSESGPPSDAVGPRADARRLVDLVSRNNALAKGRLLAMAGQHYGMEPDRAMEAFRHATEEEGLLVQTPDGEKYTT